MPEAISNTRAIARHNDHRQIDAGGVQHSDSWGLLFNPGGVAPVAPVGLRQLQACSLERRWPGFPRATLVSMRVATRSKLSPAEYLAWEREQVEKHEYHAGDVFAMAGGSPRHNWLCGNAQALLRRASSNCFTFTSDQRVVFDDGKRYVYPDTSVVCGSVELQSGTTDVLANPTILVEVLSGTTEQYDRGLKWEGYQRLPSLTDYLLVAQHEVRVEHFQRGTDSSWVYRAYGTGERVRFANGVELDVDALYERAFELPSD
jgi:Uma2 family endonuclease